MRAFILEKRGRIFRTVGAALFWLIIWFAAAALINKEVLFVSPLKVLLELFRLCAAYEFWISITNTIMRIMAGFSAAVIIGTLLAFLTSYSKIAYTLIKPAMAVINATPVASFIILALMWLKSSMLPAFISMLMVMPGIWQNVQEGISGIDKKQLEMADVFRLGKVKRLISVVIPSVIPFLLAGCISGLGFAWKSGVAAEIICLPKNSIGTNLYESKLYLQTSSLFAWTAVIVILSMIIEKLLKYVFRKLLKNYMLEEGEHGNNIE